MKVKQKKYLEGIVVYGFEVIEPALVGAGIMVLQVRGTAENSNKTMENRIILPGSLFSLVPVFAGRLGNGLFAFANSPVL